ncbi:uncharacterized protein LOC132732009 [Ruditapes philippinarum]|uniref:uncharacterized protein LOC132732009 n=1 Tax=Ruditapes philippinarum TaxID=129788 RepID=UPI00295AE16D|nr:uncharacterized protein LOC132732009 [Ruditapes philippinarum]
MSAKTENEDDVYAKLVKGLVTSVQSETVSEEAERIRAAIHFYLMAWLGEVEDINPLFKVKELIGVGSYAEGTKIIEPNEFDYLAVIDDFSKPGLLTIDKGESRVYEGLVKVKVEDDNLRSRCSHLCKSGHLQCFQPINFPKSGEHRFGHVFIEALLKYAKKNGLRWRLGEGTPIYFSGQLNLPSVNKISLVLGGVEYSAPNVLIYFKYKDREITTDLSPAIRYFQLEDCFKVDDCAGPVFAELVLSRKSLLLIGTSNESYFKITVTEAEVEYMTRVMKTEHKTIYIFLKYIAKLYQDKVYNFYPFTSYMLKTVCFHHDINCKAGKKSIRNCLEVVIDDLIVCAEQEYVISILNNHIHLKSNYPDRLLKDYGTSMLTGMKNLCILPHGINTLDAFNEFVWNVVLEEKQKRDKERDEEKKNTDEIIKKSREKIKREVSKLTDMGFTTDEAESALRRALDDPELALATLKYEAEKRKDKTVMESDVESGKEKRNESLPNTVQSNVPALNSGANETDTSINSTGESPCVTQHGLTLIITEEVIYERQKH